jgi:ADP-ribosyl-[dinitrogen reductase] hydrolase
MDPQLLDKLRGGYLGVCLGDALGTPHEHSHGPEYTGLLQYRMVQRIRYQSNREGPPGQVSDDATMTTALLWQILTDKDWVRDHVILEYLRWAPEASGSLGKNTRQLMIGVKTVQGFLNRRARIDLSNVQSNGSLMRAFPLVLLLIFQPQTAFQKAVQDTDITNPNPVNEDATLVYLLMLQAALNNEKPSSALLRILSQSQTPVIQQALAEALNRTMRMIDQQKGWVAHGIYMTARAWMMTENSGTTFSEIMKWVMDRGGDTDTNAAIAGGLVGTTLGESGLLRDPLTSRNIQILLSSDPRAGQIVYDLRYHPSTGLSMLQ